MEEYAANNIDYLLALEDVYKNHLSAIRHWNNIKVATEGETVWVKNIDFAQLNAVEIQSIPCKRIFYERNGKLFPINSQLPYRTVPSLLWTPIERAIPVSLPSFNHNFFGLHEKITIKLVPAQVEVRAQAMIADLNALLQYVDSAPAIRLKSISWAILNNDKALLMGIPLLPIDGTVFWRRGEALIPAGYDLNFHSLSESIMQQLCPENDSWLVWNTDATYFLIDKDDLQPLSRSSVRAGTEQLVL